MSQTPQKQKSPAATGLICKANDNELRNATKTPKRRPLSPRNQRLLKALLCGPQSTRDLIDAIPANNASQYVSTLRKCFGFEIPLEEVRFTTIDGKPSWYGSYHLTERDREKASELLGV